MSGQQFETLLVVNYDVMKNMFDFIDTYTSAHKIYICGLTWTMLNKTVTLICYITSVTETVHLINTLVLVCFSGMFKPGTMNAIMGPTGSGKST